MNLSTPSVSPPSTASISPVSPDDYLAFNLDLIECIRNSSIKSQSTPTNSNPSNSPNSSQLTPSSSPPQSTSSLSLSRKKFKSSEESKLDVFLVRHSKQYQFIYQNTNHIGNINPNVDINYRERENRENREKENRDNVLSREKGGGSGERERQSREREGDNREKLDGMNPDTNNDSSLTLSPSPPSLSTSSLSPSPPSLSNPLFSPLSHPSVSLPLSLDPLSDSYYRLLSLLLSNRLLDSLWFSLSREHRLRILRVIRVLTRDHILHSLFLSYQPISLLSHLLYEYTQSFFEIDPPYMIETLIEICSLLKRIPSNNIDLSVSLSSILSSLVQLLYSNDHSLLQSVLITLAYLSTAPSFIEHISRLLVVEPLLNLINSFVSNPSLSNSPLSNNPPLSNPSLSNNGSLSTISSLSTSSSLSTAIPLSTPSSLSTSAPLNKDASPSLFSSYPYIVVDLLELLSEYHECRQEIQILNGNSYILRLITKKINNCTLVTPLLRTLSNQALEIESSREIRYLGGLQSLLSILNDNLSVYLSHNDILSTNQLKPLYLSNCSFSTLSNNPNQPSSLSPSVLNGLLICLTQLSVDDENNYLLRSFHAIYTFGLYFLVTAHFPDPNTSDNDPNKWDPNSHRTIDTTLSPNKNGESSRERDREIHEMLILSAHALRALRFLYSLERNRKFFKRLFISPDLYLEFIDIGHYNINIEPYIAYCKYYQKQSQHIKRAMIESFFKYREQGYQLLRKDGSPIKIKQYILTEIIGKGAFGTVYQVRKENNNKIYAMKEIPIRELRELHSNSLFKDKDKEIDSEREREDDPYLSNSSISISDRERGERDRDRSDRDKERDKDRERESYDSNDDTLSQVCKEVDILSQLDHP
jgi:hypothetical protein